MLRCETQNPKTSCAPSLLAIAPALALAALLVFLKMQSQIDHQADDIRALRRDDLARQQDVVNVPQHTTSVLNYPHTWYLNGLTSYLTVTTDAYTSNAENVEQTFGLTASSNEALQKMLDDDAVQEIIAIHMHWIQEGQHGDFCAISIASQCVTGWIRKP